MVLRILHVLYYSFHTSVRCVFYLFPFHDKAHLRQEAVKGLAPSQAAELAGRAGRRTFMVTCTTFLIPSKQIKHQMVFYIYIFLHKTMIYV